MFTAFSHIGMLLPLGEGTSLPADPPRWRKLKAGDRVGTRSNMAEALPFAEKWARGCKRLRFLIITVWFAVTVLGYIYGLRFLDNTVSDFPAPKGSPSYAASLELISNFPDLEDVSTESLLLESVTGESVVEGPLAQQLAQFYNAYQESLTAAYPNTFKPPIIAYYPIKTLMPELAAPLVSVDGTATQFIIGYDPTGPDQARSSFLAFLLSEARRLLVAQGLGPDKVAAGLTGLGSFGEDIVDGVKKDAARMDSIVLPLAILILAMVVHSLPLMIIPILTIPVTLLGQFLVMYPVALAVDVVSFAPSLMMSLTIAMGIDYNLFQSTRFMDGVRGRLDLVDSVTLMLSSAGYIILVSGSTLCVSFLGLLFLPMEILRTLGVGAAISIIMALAVNLTLVPALLFAMGPYLLKVDHWLNTFLFVTLPRRLGLSRLRRRGHRPAAGKQAARDEFDPSEREGTEPLLDGSDADDGSVQQRGLSDDDGQDRPRRDSLSSVHSYVHELDAEVHFDRSCWRGLARLVVKKWWGAVVFLLVLALAIPVMLQVLRIQPSVEFELMLPYDSDSYDTLEIITNKFGGPGMVFPYRLLMVLTDPIDSSTGLSPSDLEGEGILSKEAYDAMTYTVQELIDRVPNTRLSDFTGVMALGGKYVTYDDMAKALNSSSFDPYDITLKTLAATVVSGDRQATYATVTLSIDPYSPVGKDWLESARDVLSSLQGQTGLSLYLEGGGGTVLDAVGSVLEVFPVMVSITLTIVFVLIGLAFKSVIAPLRSVLTISITLAFVYGLTVIVYQGGALDGLGARSLSKVGAVAWLPIVICFSIIVGLGLDYDVFLVSRVLEERLDGYTDRASLVRGMVSTGHIITAAGVIMAVAFSGLLFSSELVLNQTAFLMVASVLLDTFVVRTLLVPILMTFSGTYTWWPRKDLPPPTQDWRP